MRTKIGQYTTISEDVEIGEDVVIYNFANLYGCKIGRFSQIGTFVEIQERAIIGEHVRIQSHTFICSDVEVGDHVFIGHGVMFVNDKYPSTKSARKRNWKSSPIKVQRNVSIGTGATILSGVTLGEGCIIGAGSVVTKDIPPYYIALGNPAKVTRKCPNASL